MITMVSRISVAQWEQEHPTAEILNFQINSFNITLYFYSYACACNISLLNYINEWITLFKSLLSGYYLLIGKERIQSDKVYTLTSIFWDWNLILNQKYIICYRETINCRSTSISIHLDKVYLVVCDYDDIALGVRHFNVITITILHYFYKDVLSDIVSLQNIDIL